MATVPQKVANIRATSLVEFTHLLFTNLSKSVLKKKNQIWVILLVVLETICGLEIAVILSGALVERY
jgi:hypothetical protein